MQASTVLLPAPEAPNRPSEQPWSNSMATLTWSSRRFLMMWALSMALTLGQHMNQPGERQSRREKYNQQRHHRGQSKALQVHPELDRHSRGIVRCYHYCTEFTNGPHPGDAEGHRQSQAREWQRDAQKNFGWGKSERGSLFLQHRRDCVQGSHSTQNVIAHANVNLRGDKCGGAVGHY